MLSRPTAKKHDKGVLPHGFFNNSAQRGGIMQVFKIAVLVLLIVATAKADVGEGSQDF